MKKQKKKHSFTHPDPEKVIISIKEEKSVKPRKIEAENPQLKFIFRDLKGSVITISIFVALLFLIYFLEIQYGILDIIKGIIS